MRPDTERPAHVALHEHQLPIYGCRSHAFSFEVLKVYLHLLSADRLDGEAFTNSLGIPLIEAYPVTPVRTDSFRGATAAA